jgi:thiol-disulfide isomerase/thioredoxin
MRQKSKSYTYSEYQSFFEGLALDNSSDELIKKIKLNWSSAKRGDKTYVSLPETTQFLSNLKKKYKLLIITEPWCGDAAQIVPVIAGLAKESSNLEVEVVLRDENDSLMSRHLTNGGKAVPIIVIVDQNTDEELGSWGPRPSEAQKIVIAYKALPEEERAPYSDFVQKMKMWYKNDKTVSIQQEFIKKVTELCS